MTPTADQIQLDTLQARTGYSEFWTSSSGAVVRLIDPRLCDGQFRQRLERLRQQNYPSIASIAGTGWLGMKFYIEYRLQGRWAPLANYWTPMHWRIRLAFFRRICELLPEWAHAVGYPVGINPANIVAVELAGQWFPWLLPCPAVTQSSTFEFLNCDPKVLACVAPEAIRGVALDGRSQDSYALGALAWQLLGATILDQQLSPGEQVEAQACGWLLGDRLGATAIEPFLQSSPEVQNLARVAVRHTQTNVVARPVTAGDMLAACDAAFTATDPLRMATNLFQAARSREALTVVDWGLSTFSPTLPLYLTGAEIAGKIEDFARAASYLDHAVDLAPGDLELRFRRCDVCWRVYRRGRRTRTQENAEQEDLLLQDLELSKGLRPDRPTAEPYLRRAYILEQRGDLHSAAAELYAGSEAEPSDIRVAYEYAKVLRTMKEVGLAREARAEGLRRVDLMVKAGMMDEREARTWRELFDSLL